MSDISSNLRSFFTYKVRNYNSIYIVNGFLENYFHSKQHLHRAANGTEAFQPPPCRPTANKKTVWRCSIAAPQSNFSQIYSFSPTFG